MSAFADDLRAKIKAPGGLSVASYMARCNAHYYATRDPFGTDGDFLTAPEISQMFGELVGAWVADIHARAGGPVPVRLVELGPGRGTLMADALRAVPPLRAAEVHFIETSPALSDAQAARVAGATWHDSLEDVPSGAPVLLIANEFFDALPIEQSVGGTPRRVVADGDDLAFDPAEGDIVETSSASQALVAEIAARLRA
ncbi:MAG: SAM-dependent methyltransferase, partial [Pacificimonas sp.]